MSYIVCGWYTPDYQKWWDKLRPTLDAVGAPHHVDQVPQIAGSWEARTCRKAEFVKQAMRRYPHETILFLDVDCTVRRPLDELADIPGDFGICSTVKYEKRRWHSISTIIQTRSGTLVLKPTDRCREMVGRWCQEAENAPLYVHDQQALALAMTQVPGLTVTNIGTEWCAVPRDHHPDPGILHDQASKGQHAKRWTKRLAYLSDPLKARAA